MRVGYHVNKLADSFAASLETAKERISGGFPDGVHPAAQIFVHGPRTHESNVTEVEAEELRDVSGVELVIHGAYPDYPWKHNPQAIAGIRGELKLADAMDATGVIIHLGLEAASRETLLRVLGKIDKDLDLTDRRTLWLETNVTTPEKAEFSSPEGLRRLLAAANSRTYANIRVGLCLDTAHLHSCGVKLHTAAQAKRFLDDLPRSKYLLHLNDSELPLGCGRDQHAPLGRGKIWEHDRTGLRAFVKWARRTRTTIILERRPEDLDHDFTVLRHILDEKK